MIEIKMVLRIDDTECEGIHKEILFDDFVNDLRNTWDISLALNDKKSNLPDEEELYNIILNIQEESEKHHGNINISMAGKQLIVQAIHKRIH